jgi:hypothetical protein
MIGLDVIDRITGGKVGKHNVACLLCGPQRSTKLKRHKKVLHVWRDEPGFARYFCRRCRAHGYARDPHGPPLDPAKIAATRHQAAEDDRATTAQRLELARWLWRRRRPLIGSIGAIYLRGRGYHGVLPATLGYLPPWRDHPPALIAAFGTAREVDPVEQARCWNEERDLPLPTIGDALITPVVGPAVSCTTLSVADDAVLGVHLIKLRVDGTDRLRDVEDAKITIGRGFAAPIILAPPNDGLALTIGEGIEKVLSDHQVSGAGAWASASASRLLGLAPLVPSYIECVTILLDDNDAGRKGANDLAAALHARGIEVLLTPTGEARS